MKKKVWVMIIILAVVAIVVFLFVTNKDIKFETYGSSEKEIIAVQAVEELDDGSFYVWHNDKEDDIRTDLINGAKEKVFMKCPAGDVNWEDNEYVNHTIWFTSENDVEIPTYYPGDELIYVSSTYVPYKGINWERFADYGYTIGVANLKVDKSGHYRIVNDSGDGYEGYIYQKSDASELEKYENVSNLFLDKIGDLEVRETLISKGGTILGIEKDKDYICEWYTGTYYQDYKLKANIHTFGSLETFTTYDYEFLHSRCISITIPDWIKTGYYYIDEIGFFRYVSEDDAKRYNGEPYDESIDWNEPIIVRDEEGTLLYDPTGDEVYIYNVNGVTEQGILSDVGAEGYESIENETIMQ